MEANNLLKEIVRLRETVRGIETTASGLQEILKQRIADYVNKDPKYDGLPIYQADKLEITYAWRCEETKPNKSPIGFCVYYQEEDPCLDSCLFCGDPHERK